MTRLATRLARNFGIAALFVGAALAGTLSGVVFAFSDDLPEISALDDYAPSTITRVVGRGGALVGEFATERRVVVSYNDIPPVLRNALVAAEDGNFFEHGGLDFRRLAVAMVRYATGCRRCGGASTITQQLARSLFLTTEFTPERKVKEWLLSLQIEKRYTKEEILAMFANKMYWGHGIYGVAAASQLYFAKPMSELTLDEAAMIAGIHQSNARQSPYNNMAAAIARRDYALERMVDEGYITRAEADAAKTKPIVTHGQPTPPPSAAPYFVENVRIELEQRYGTKALYENGLTIQTGIDPELQHASTKALDAGVRKLDKLHGFRKPARNVGTDARSIDAYRHSRWGRDIRDGDIIPAVVTAVSDADIRVRAGRLTGTIGRSGYEWTRRRPRDLVRPGDLVEVRVARFEPDGAGAFTASLEQPPLVQGAVVALENRTGQILAMVGGESFERSQFNRATQAMRQVGSLFKPFVYAAAIDRGYTTQSLIEDTPASFIVGPNQPPYEPGNYDHEYRGTITLRDALEDSRNVPAVRLMAALGPHEVVSYARRLGITAPLPEFLSVAIGSAEATLIEMVAAYAAFANQGVRMKPLGVLEVRDRDGNILEQHRAEPHEAIRADTAYITMSMLQGVIERGTGAAARALDWPLAGKTGTTDDYSDAWFIGFDPNITIGVWVGFDQKRPIGANQTGSVAALPIWQDIMKSWVDRQRAAGGEPPAFERPGNIVTATTERGSDVFIAGTEPQ
jgi:penicillin-binding protein 1A